MTTSGATTRPGAVPAYVVALPGRPIAQPALTWSNDFQSARRSY
ncbi:hypothetical protein [Mycolicibacterium novocastrense]|nr:hypothetical protein [Mycolicibacterium novocastrense]